MMSGDSILFKEMATRYLFFTGKGGVGKTSLSCAMAVALADQGKQVLLVSTDPASNLDEVLGTPLSSQPAPVHGVAGLSAVNLDPQAAADAYRERVVGPYRNVLPEAAINSIEEQLSGACTVEIAAFDEFAKLLGDREATQAFDHVIFDTAPTGHTLRLLALPGAWNGFIEANPGGVSCLGPLAGLQTQRALYAAAVDVLSDSAQTTLVLVSRPDNAALAEAERARGELAALGVRNQHLVLNGVFTASSGGDVIAEALEQRGVAAVAAMPAPLAALPRSEVTFIPQGLVGLSALRALAQPSAARAAEATTAISPLSSMPPSLAVLVDELAAAGRGVIMTMGKGGVGKTTVAAAIATELARSGHRVLLTTTDPAAHVASTVGTPEAGLRVGRIDPAVETRKYQEEIMAAAGTELDAPGRALLEEELNSPCTEEIAVFRAFARAVAEGEDGFVVLDTAPTGHTLLLLDAAATYHREIARNSGGVPSEVRQLSSRLRDAAYTRVLVMALPEATPVHEAERLQVDLRRAGIEPFAWVINQSFLASGTRDPLLRQRGYDEIPFIQRVATTLSSRCTLIPWLADAAVGPTGLRGILQADAA